MKICPEVYKISFYLLNGKQKLIFQYITCQLHSSRDIFTNLIFEWLLCICFSFTLVERHNSDFHVFNLIIACDPLFMQLMILVM